MHTLLRLNMQGANLTGARLTNEANSNLSITDLRGAEGVSPEGIPNPYTVYVTPCNAV
jgi:uncharacterized protein YjbI with pentapeptide repeats